MEYYTLEIGKVKRKLPIIQLTPKIKIASFNLLGDRILVEELAKSLFQKLKKYEFDFLVGPEVKVVPLLHELSKLFKKERYIICRKNIHGYMVSPTKTGNKPFLVVDGRDAEIIKGKKVIIIDDVITSGRTLKLVEDLMNKAGAKTIAKIAIFKQGNVDEKGLTNFEFLYTLPLLSD